MKLEYEVVINKPVAEVFDFLVTNFCTNYPKIVDDVISVSQFPNGPIREGTILEVLIALELTQGMDFVRKNGKLKLEFDELKPNLRGPKTTESFQVINYELNKTFVIQYATSNSSKIKSFFFLPQGNKTLLKYEFQEKIFIIIGPILDFISKSGYDSWNKDMLKKLEKLLS